MKHFLSIADFTREELTAILDRADELRDLWRANAMPKSLLNERIGLWFYGNGFRNRVAFEMGARSMGADVSYVPGELGVHEPLEDVAGYLGNWFTMLVVRAKHHGELAALAAESAIPVVNARTNLNHPCEIMGDLQYIRNRRGSLDGLKVAFVGEVTNLCMSWFEAAMRFPITVIQVSPEKYRLPEEEAFKMNLCAIGKIQTSSSLEESVNATVDVLYTDCWPRGRDPRRNVEDFSPYRITKRVAERINPDGFFLPCPPVTRGNEITATSLEARQYRNREAKEYLLHAQNAIMERLASGSG